MPAPVIVAPEKILKKAYVFAGNADIVEPGIAIVHGYSTLLRSLVFDNDARQRGMIFERSQWDQKRMGTVVFSIDDKFGLNDRMIGDLSQGADPELCRRLGG